MHPIKSKIQIATEKRNDIEINAKKKIDLADAGPLCNTLTRPQAFLFCAVEISVSFLKLYIFTPSFKESQVAYVKAP